MKNVKVILEVKEVEKIAIALGQLAEIAATVYGDPAYAAVLTAMATKLWKQIGKTK